MSYLGDFDTNTVIHDGFTLYRASTGAPFTLGGTPALSVYKDGSTTQSVAGVSLVTDFDGITGNNYYAVDTSADGTFYSAGGSFRVIITTGTVDSVSAEGTIVGRFTLRKTSALKPTTAGRTLDVSAGGEAGLDWANVGSPTTAVNLSATNIDVDQVVASVSGNVAGSVASVTNTVTVGTNNDKTGYALSSGGITAIWAEVITGTTTAVQAMRGFLAVLLGKASGLATTTAVFRNVADTKDVVTATVDSSGNRTAVTTDLT